MPRMRISENGPEVAAPGHDVDTAPLEHMMFSPTLVAMRLASQGTVSVGSFSGLLSDMYYRGIVNFDTPFVRAPVIMVAGLNADGSADQSFFFYNVANGSEAWNRPYIQVDSYPDRFELFVLVRNGDGPIITRPTNWRYFVFANTLDAS